MTCAGASVRARGERLQRTGVALALAAAASALVLGVRYAGRLQPLEHMVYDAYLRFERPRQTDERIFIIEVREQDIREQGRWPLSDAMLASVVRQLRDAGAAAIGIDIYRDLPVPPGTGELEAAMSNTPRAVFVRHVGEGRMRSIPAPPRLEGTAQVGFNDVILDADGSVRRGLLFLEDGSGEAVYSLGLRLALVYLRDHAIFPAPDASDPNQLSLGAARIAALESNDGGYVGVDAAGYQTLLDFRGAATSFSSATLGDLLAGRVDPGRIRGRIVLVGLSAESTNDFFHLPFLPDAASLANSGVVLHAHLASQLVREALGESRPLTVLPEWQEVAAVIALGLLAGVGGLWIRGARALVAAAAVALAALWIGGHALYRQGVWLPVVPPALSSLGGAVLVTAYVSSQERRQRALLMQLFSRHLSPRVAEEVWRRRDEFLDGGRPRSQRLAATVLFLDMKGYSASAEKLAPEVLMGWANEFMQAMADLVMRHAGLVDDYFGDGLKAVFGVPLASTADAEIRADARNAVRCALEMEQALARLNLGWRARGLPAVAMRIGIASGPVVAGSLGSENRLKYTTVGDVVVTAARLESLDDVAHDFEMRPCRILVSEGSRAFLDGGFATEEVGTVRLKGREKPERVHRVVGGSLGKETAPEGGPAS